MLNLYDTIFGITVFTFPRMHGKEALNAALERGKECKAQFRGENVLICCAQKDVSFLRRIFNELSLEILAEKEIGFFPLLRRNKRRIGVPVGAFLFFLVVFLSGSIVWRIDISGNTVLSNEKILTVLEESGLRIGSSAAFEAGAVAARCVAENEELAWMSIRMEGTTAKVKVMEAKLPQLPNAREGQNLVATRDALITSVEASRGRVAVSPGMVVREGDVLVSGVVDGAHGNLFVVAEGTVWGQVTECFREEISLTAWEKRYLPPQNREIWIKILGFSINIFKSTGNLPSTYDTIYMQNTLRIGGQELPLSLGRVQCVPFTVTERTLSKDTAVKYAEALLYEKVRAAVGKGELLETNTEVRFEEGKCVSIVTVTYITEIARCVPFEIHE